MPRLYKFALIGFFAYALVTATPEQQTEIGQGLLAVKDAAIDACTVEGRLCSRILTSALSAAGDTLTDGPPPWLDEKAKRTAPTHEPRSDTSGGALSN